MFLRAEGISKVYKDVSSPLWVLKGLDFCLEAGECVGIFGASGAGKSTLLHVLGGIDLPTEGDVIANDRHLVKMSADELAKFRNEQVGFVFQFYHLLAEFSATENVMLPALIKGYSKKVASEMARTELVSMGLDERLNHMPAMLSGGEQQRVAIARAAVLKPKLILADEPTGNLDQDTGEMIFQYLMNLNKKEGISLIIVTHNRDLLGRLPKCYELSGGRLRLI